MKMKISEATNEDVVKKFLYKPRSYFEHSHVNSIQWVHKMGPRNSCQYTAITYLDDFLETIESCPHVNAKASDNVLSLRPIHLHANNFEFNASFVCIMYLQHKRQHVAYYLHVGYNTNTSCRFLQRIVFCQTTSSKT